MSVTFIDDLPRSQYDLGQQHEIGELSLCTRGLSAFICSPKFTARFSLQSGQIDWLVERPPFEYAKSTWELPRRISPFGLNLWCSEDTDLLAEALPTPDGGLLLVGRDATRGRQLWEHFIPIQDVAICTETAPACPDAPTEEVYAFLADDSKYLTLCLFQQTRQSGLSYPARGINVFTLPPLACQTDATRCDPTSGKAIWRATFLDLRVGILERRCFTGIWSHNKKAGIVDFRTGTNTFVYESANELGWPVRYGAGLAVPWHSKKVIGVDWIDLHGNPVRQAKWRHSKVLTTQLHATGSGLALQTNEQMLWWLGDEEAALWNVRVKPYIYHVYRSPASDVFVGTDGRGGRLFAFDAISGKETLNLRPRYGGAGVLEKVSGHDVLVGRFGVSRTDCQAGRLLVVFMNDRSHMLAHECRHLIGTWQHGAVCLTGSKSERLSIVDIR